MTKTEQITYVKDFINRWEKSESDFLENGQEYKLIHEFQAFCENESLPHIPADELLIKLLEE